MSIFINGAKRVNSIFANVNGETKKIVSAWANKDGVATKIFESVFKGFLCGGKGIYRSRNGRAWESISETSITSIAYGKNGVVGISGNGKPYYGEPGETLVQMSGVPDDVKLTSVTYGRGRFVAVGWDGKAYYCTDNSTWYEMTGLSTIDFNDVVYRQNYDEFICVGNGGSIYRSFDHETWQSLGDIRGAGDLEAVTVNEYYLVVASDGELYYSDEYIPEYWNRYNLSASGIGDIVYNATWDKFIAVSGREVYIIDSDFTTASEASGISASAGYYGVACSDNGVTVIVGEWGTSYYSTDGETWVASTGLDTTKNYYCITYATGAD